MTRPDRQAVTHRMRRVAAVVVAYPVLLGAAVAMEMAGDVPAARAATVIHVSPRGSNSASGSATSPVRTVARAVEMAPSVATVMVHSGTYHESVQVFAKDLDIVAAPGASVVFDGARPVSGWTQSGNAWSTRWTASFPRSSGTPVLGIRPMAGYPDLAFRNGRPLRQVARRSSVGPGTFFVDTAADLLWVGDNPTGQLIEASDLSWALYFNRANGSSLRGVTVRRYATTAGDMAAVRLYGNNIYMADCTVSLNAYKGVSVIGKDVRMERLYVADNAYIGVHGHQSERVSLLRSTIVRNNAEGFDAVHSGSGVKFTTSSVVSVRSSYVADNLGVGIWTDLAAAYIDVVGNLSERNTYSGILIELSGQAVVADNTVLDNGEAGIWILESNDVDVYHNAAYRNFPEIWVEEGPRTDPSANSIVNWDLERVRLRNNIVGHERGNEEALVSVDDWTEKRSFVSMGVTSDANLYWLPAGATSTKLARWARWPAPLAVSATLSTHRARTGQDRASQASRASSNPWARNMSGYDFRVPTGGPMGEALPSRVANALGLTTGSQLPIGPRRAMAPSRGGTGVSFS